MTVEDKEKVLLESDKLGRCVFDGPQDLVDHQVTSVVFDNGVTATLNMIGGTSYPCRTLHIITTSGEMFGVMEEGKLFVSDVEEEWLCLNCGHVHKYSRHRSVLSMRLMKYPMTPECMFFFC